MSSHVCFLLVVIIGIAGPVWGHFKEPENDVPSLLRDIEVNKVAALEISNDDDDFEVEFVYPKKDPSGGPEPLLSALSGVKRLWGVPDTETWVGRMFSYPIPSDAFEGDVRSYEFPSLPSWLSFNSRRRVLEGVPGPSDLGHHYITINAEGMDGGDSAKDAFAVQVSFKPVAKLLKEAKCDSQEEISMLSIVIDSTFSALRPRQRLQLIQKISNLFMVKPSMISLTSTPADFDPLSDDSAILAGPGSSNSKLSIDHAAGPIEYTQVQWSIGCSGNILDKEQEQVDNVELSASNGKLQRLIGVPVVGWHVSKVDPITKRIKRNTEQEYSGDYAEENDYEYDYAEYFNNLEKVVPTLATPVFPDSQPSSAVLDGHQYVSPVFKPVPLSTPVFVPVKPTRVVVDASPTIVFRTEYPHEHSEVKLESSLLTHPTTSADYTTPLTRSTVATSEPTRGAGPIDATSVPDKSETTEYAVKNFPPRINNRIQKLAWIAGNVYRMQIPKDTFSDVEDGDTRNLTLILKDEGGLIFPRDYWIQFDPTNQEVYALPLEKDIGVYDFRLEAIDKDRKSVKDIFTVNVRQHTQARNFHHQFTAVLKLEKKYEYDFAYALDWQVKGVEKIAALFQDKLSSINVRNITTNPVQITWTNVSLIDSSSTMCPTEELEAIAEIMLSGHGTEPSRDAEKVFKPEFQLKKIRTHFYDPCEPHFHHGRHHGHKESDAYPFAPIEEHEQTGVEEINSSPIVRNQIDLLTALAGRLFRYQVPIETCYDIEDGNSYNLKIRLLTTDFITPPKDSWLQFDSANREFFGLPLIDDLGRKEYLLECMDKGGKTVTDALIVEVIRNMSSISTQTPVHFGLTIDMEYDSFMSNAHQKAKLIDRIGLAFGDTNASNVVVDFLRKGSVVVEWHNGSLPSDPCPEDEVKKLRDIMTDDNGQLRKKFKKAFLPEFKVVNGEVIPSGKCLADDTLTHDEEPDIGTSEEDDISSSDEDYLLTFIVPAVIIAVMLLLAAVIACCLYKRRRYGKMSMTDDRTFVSKGIPIIFAEELDDHRTDSAKSPVIMKEEKPPLPPPEYQRNSPPTSRQRTHSGDGNLSDDAPYHPPPPFTSTNGASRNQRPNLPPAYRKPPTYVPP